MRTWLIAAALGAAGCSGIALAAQEDAPPPPGMPRAHGMMRADTNGDGVLTRDEALADADARFARMDVNRDGVLTPDERPMHGPHGMAGDAPPPGGPDAAAADHSPRPMAGPPRTITREQFRAMSLRRFDRMDTNHDGKVDRAELRAGMEQMHERRGQMDGGTPPPPPAGE